MAKALTGGLIMVMTATASGPTSMVTRGVAISKHRKHNRHSFLCFNEEGDCGVRESGYEKEG